MLKLENFYVVKCGRVVGIFKTWDETKKSVLNYKNSLYKKFDNLTDAELWFNSSNEQQPQEEGGVIDKQNKKKRPIIDIYNNSYQSLENSLCIKTNFKDLFSEYDDFLNIEWVRKDYYYISAICENYYMAAISYWENYNINNRWEIPTAINDAIIMNSCGESKKHSDTYIVLKSNQKRYMCDKMLFEFFLNLLQNMMQTNNVNFTTIINNDLEEQEKEQEENVENNNFVNLNLYFTNKAVYRVLKYWIQNKFSIFENSIATADTFSTQTFNFEQLKGNLDKMYHSYCYKILTLIYKSQKNNNNDNNVKRNIILNFVLLPAKSNSELYKKSINMLNLYSQNNNKLVKTLDF